MTPPVTSPGPLLSALLLQAVEVLLFVLRKSPSASVLARSMEGLEACLSPDYCTPLQVQRRSRLPSESSVEEERGLAEDNMEAVMAQRQWLSWFHGLANTLYVRSVDEAGDGPLALHRHHPPLQHMAMADLPGSASSDSDSLAGSEDGSVSMMMGEMDPELMAGDVALSGHTLPAVLDPIYR